MVRRPEVKEHAPARTIVRVCGHECAELGKRRMDERKPHFVGKAAAAGLDGLRIPVEREQAAFSTQGLENECRMTATPERRIDHSNRPLPGPALQAPQRRAPVCAHPRAKRLPASLSALTKDFRPANLVRDP